MESKQAVLNFLGISRRANQVVSGEDTLLTEIRSGKVHFLFIAADAGAATRKKFLDKSNYYHVPVNSMYTKEVLSNAIGMKRTIIGIKDPGISKKMIELTNRIKGE